ncbi:MAG: helix-turn-helix transcriptional regulator [Gemmatimonadota bacterium]|nr:helix-turn-helix transcriptional regulator [Gemmatimonadota bacterium]
MRSPKMPMPPLERKVALMRAGVTQTAIARQAGVTVSHVSEVMYGRRRSPRIEQAIAEALKLPVAAVFEPVAEKIPAGAAAE